MSLVTSEQPIHILNLVDECENLATLLDIRSHVDAQIARVMRDQATRTASAVVAGMFTRMEKLEQQVRDLQHELSELKR